MQFPPSPPIPPGCGCQDTSDATEQQQQQQADAAAEAERRLAGQLSIKSLQSLPSGGAAGSSALPSARSVAGR